jgi:HAD superfamily hydrolase (TIGR01509 family)
MKAAEIGAVIFDLDGTLIESSRLYGECYRRAFVAELGTAPEYAEMMRRKPASERHFLIDWHGEAIGHRIHERMCEAYEELAGTMLAMYPGVKEMLDLFGASGLPLAVVTGKSRRAYRATCRHLPLDRFFEIAICEDDVPAPKPDPRGLVLALERLGVDPERSVYVGDTPMDTEAAQRARMIGAAALWSRPHAEREHIAGKIEPSVWLLHSPEDLARKIPSVARAAS